MWSVNLDAAVFVWIYGMFKNSVASGSLGVCGFLAHGDSTIDALVSMVAATGGDEPCSMRAVVVLTIVLCAVSSCAMCEVRRFGRCRPTSDARFSYIGGCEGDGGLSGGFMGECAMVA